jgi:hypothetical protein
LSIEDERMIIKEASVLGVSADFSNSISTEC